VTYEYEIVKEPATGRAGIVEERRENAGFRGISLGDGIRNQR